MREAGQSSIRCAPLRTQTVMDTIGPVTHSTSNNSRRRRHRILVARLSRLNHHAGTGLTVQDNGVQWNVQVDKERGEVFAVHHHHHGLLERGHLSHSELEARGQHIGGF